MWPKAFAQLIELAPHISRLLPMADRFFQSKAASDDAQRRTMEALASSLGDTLDARLKDFTTASTQQLAQLTAATSQHSTQLQAVTQRLERAANDAQAARFTAESLDSRLAKLEGQHTRLLTLLLLNGGLSLLVLVLLGFAVLHIR